MRLKSVICVEVRREVKTDMKGLTSIKPVTFKDLISKPIYKQLRKITSEVGGHLQSQNKQCNI